jgi:hypothetical protein
MLLNNIKLSSILFVLVFAYSCKTATVFHGYKLECARCKFIQSGNTLIIHNNQGNKTTLYKEEPLFYKLSMEEYVINSFHNYHYAKFFDKIFLDAKLHKLYRDSITISSVKKIIKGEDPNCKSCNLEATVTFREYNLPYGLNIPEDQIASFQEKMKLEYSDFKMFYYINNANYMGKIKNSKEQSLYFKTDDVKKIKKYLSVTSK